MSRILSRSWVSLIIGLDGLVSRARQNTDRESHYLSSRYLIFLSLVVEQPFDPRSLFTLQDTAVPRGVSSSGGCSSSKEVDFIEDRGVFDEELRTSTSNFSHRYGTQPSKTNDQSTLPNMNTRTAKSLLLAFASLLIVALPQSATAQSEDTPGTPETTHGASSSHTVKINVPKLSAIEPPEGIIFNIQSGKLDQELSEIGKELSESASFTVTTNNPNKRAVEVEATDIGNDDYKLAIDDNDDGSNFAPLIDRINSGDSGSGSSPIQTVESGIDGVHEETFDVRYGVVVGPNFDPTKNQSITVTYTLVSN
jgi:hypothetical protein